ncbi:MAG: MoaD/ThiS family protein [Candidatus Micrarchaeota archaeon]|nr:MoaD/ThiS family protein [Candidatus Micrarchaeota archaeon]
MKITVDGRKTSVKGARTVGEILSALKLSPEETLVKVDGKLAPEDTKVSGKDEVKVIRVIFGG